MPQRLRDCEKVVVKVWINGAAKYKSYTEPIKFTEPSQFEERVLAGYKVCIAYLYEAIMDSKSK
jgi:hypothetical protein